MRLKSDLDLLVIRQDLRRDVEAMIVADVIAFLFLVREAFLLEAIHQFDTLLEASEELHAIGFSKENGFDTGALFLTRRTDGARRTFALLQDALLDAKDPEVWMISFPIHTGERVRLVRQELIGPGGVQITQWRHEATLPSLVHCSPDGDE